jgi:hypothetical protein
MRHPASSPFRRPLRVAAALLLGGTQVHALTWDRVHQQVSLTPMATEAEVQYHYRNDSKEPVAILHVETNCECLGATPSRKKLAPGETGTLTARFTVGDRIGLYERHILVLTSESATPTRLTARFEVPELAAVTPRTIEWTLDAEAQEKPVKIVLSPGLEFEPAEIGYSSAGFRARLETVAAGREYRLWIKPDGTAHPASAAVRVIGREKSGRPVVLSAYASVR